MINGLLLRDAIISGANAIINQKKLVDELNIFPVPDGDTGTNMSMTITAAKEELSKLDVAEVSIVSKKAASAMLRGARGNSGVILSLLFKGIGRGLADKEKMGGKEIVEALELGVADAYKAVMKPTEGTILTVARVAAETARAELENTDDFLAIWDAICQGAAEALEDTPRLLPVLKKAGVIDAGGKGLCIIFEGMRQVFNGGEITALKEKTQASADDDFFKNAAAEFDQEINFTYCTEFIVGKDKDAKDSDTLRAYLMTIGDCVVVADDDDIIKVHVHTENPGKALQKALDYGQLLTVKVENMKEQHRKAAEENERVKAQAAAEAAASLEKCAPTEEYGFVAVAAGEGLVTLFNDLGCVNVVSGGQTMNPSTDDIFAAIMATPAKVVYVFPNNKNIIMAAEQAVPLAEDRRVVVVPTRTIPQGISALLAYDSESSEEDNLQAMLDAASNVSTGSVTFAARDSEFGSFKIKKDDILALDNGKLVSVGRDPVASAYRLIRSMADKNTSYITIIYGSDVTDEAAQILSDRVSAKLGDDVEVTLVSGGQPVYYFIISIE